MTLQEAIKDKNRPLSVSPHEWMQYEQAKEYEEEQLIEAQIKRIVVDQNPDISEDNIMVDVEDKLDIGIQQMILGCRISMKALQELDRKNVTIQERQAYSQIKKLIYNAVAPYLADVLKSRKGLYK